MRCPFCGYEETKVVDSRPTDEKIRRRRECLNCFRRFTTYEVVETMPLVVVKKDKSREIFDRTKLLNGLVRACEKRPVSLERLDTAVNDIEFQLLNTMEREVPSVQIGEMAMQRLKEIDEVAYVRFVSVYREFGDIHSFMEELKLLMSEK